MTEKKSARDGGNRGGRNDGGEGRMGNVTPSTNSDNQDSTPEGEEEMHLDYNGYERLHQLEAQAEADSQRIVDLGRRLLDLEAEAFADRCEAELDLARWGGPHSAEVGRDLERLSDGLNEAIDACVRGEDVGWMLADLDDDVRRMITELEARDYEGHVFGQRAWSEDKLSAGSEEAG